MPPVVSQWWQCVNTKKSIHAAIKRVKPCKEPASIKECGKIFRWSSFLNIHSLNVKVPGSDPLETEPVSKKEQRSAEINFQVR